MKGENFCLDLKENVKEIRAAICKFGVGIMGNYSCCTSSVSALGVFKPNENIGSLNTLECVEEEILAFLCHIDKLKKILT